MIDYHAKRGLDLFKFEKTAGQMKEAFIAKDYRTSKDLLYKLVPFNTSPVNLGFLGPGIPFFFIVIRFCLVTLFLMFLLSGLSNLVMNNLYGVIPEGETWNWVNRGTIGAIIGGDEGFIDVLQIQIFATILILIAFFQIIRKQLRETVTTADDDEVTPDDFSVMVSRMPKLELRHAKDPNFKKILDEIPAEKKAKRQKVLI